MEATLKDFYRPGTMWTQIRELIWHHPGRKEEASEFLSAAIGEEEEMWRFLNGATDWEIDFL